MSKKVKDPRHLLPGKPSKKTYNNKRCENCLRVGSMRFYGLYSELNQKPLFFCDDKCHEEFINYEPQQTKCGNTNPGRWPDEDAYKISDKS